MLNFPNPLALRTQLSMRGVPLDGDTGAALGRYEAALGRLAFLTLAIHHQGECADEGGTMSYTEAVAVADAEISKIKATMADFPQSGVGN